MNPSSPDISPMTDLSPREIVSELDRFIVGQDDAKRAVAVALRNRWRRKRVPDDLRDEVTPKNILMIGPTGVGKTEIARRLARLAGSPFLKVEATKFTEVGYVGRDVDSIMRDLVEAALVMVRDRRRSEVKARAEAAAGVAGQGLMEAQEHQDAVQALDRLEKRVFYLQQAKQIGIQQLPQIRIIQASDETLMEQLQASTRLTIPLWKQKMVLLLGLNRQKEALDLQKNVTDATNAMLKQTSDMMKGQALAIEEASQRGIVDLETLEKANADLIETLQGVIQLQQQGRDQRAQVETRLQGLTEELRQALIDTRFDR